MPRNGSGVYSLPQPPFVPNTVIASSAVNSDFSDIAAALTGSVARDGQGGMTGAFLAIDGTVGAPGIAFAADPNTGIRRVASDEMAATVGGVDALTITGTGVGMPLGGTVTGLLAITGTQTITATVANALSITTSAVGAMIALTCTDAGAADGPTIEFFRDSASPLAGDEMAQISFFGRDSGAGKQLYGAIDCNINDPTAGSEDSTVRILTTVAGTTVAALQIANGIMLQGATGGFQGSGTINATGYFLNGAALTGGKVAQQVSDSEAGYLTLGTILPFDDTIPQITEGDEILTVAITPTNAGSTLDIQVTLPTVGGGAAMEVSAALFVDATANALAMGGGRVAGTASVTPIVFQHSVAAGSTAARTYRVRAGSAIATDAKLNGDNTARIGGGVTRATLTVTEILP